MIWQWQSRRTTPDADDILKGVAAGMVGGLVGSLVMNQVHTVSRALQRASGYSGNGVARQRLGDPPSATGRRAPANGRGRTKAQGKSGGTSKVEERGESASQESATVRAAQAVSRRLTGRELGFRQERRGGQVAHYGFGMVMGAIYGGLTEVLPKTTKAFGLPFGIAVWLFGDELMLPLLGLGRKPTQVPLSLHAESFAAHLVYGLTSDTVRRLLRPTTG